MISAASPTLASESRARSDNRAPFEACRVSCVFAGIEAKCEGDYLWKYETRVSAESRHVKMTHIREREIRERFERDSREIRERSAGVSQKDEFRTSLLKNRERGLRRRAVRLAREETRSLWMGKVRCVASSGVSRSLPCVRRGRVCAHVLSQLARQRQGRRQGKTLFGALLSEERDGFQV